MTIEALTDEDQAYVAGMASGYLDRVLALKISPSSSDTFASKYPDGFTTYDEHEKVYEYVRDIFLRLKHGEKIHWSLDLKRAPEELGARIVTARMADNCVLYTSSRPRIIEEDDSVFFVDLV